MAQKDIYAKKIEDYPEVFADIYNVLLFRENYIEPDKLTAGPTESIYKAESDEYREQRRDVLKRYKDETSLCIAMFGIENQAMIDAVMPIRIMNYDAASYKQQVTDQAGKYYPVITIVLNMSDKRWSGATSIHELTKVSGKLSTYVQDYRIQVFDIAYLEDEVIEEFQSDFKEIANFFKAKRLGTEITSRRKMKHIEEVLEFLSLFADDNRIRDVEKDLTEAERKEGVSMCEMIDKIENRGIEKGRIEGRIEGAYEFGATVSEIAVRFSLTEEQVKRILEGKKENS